MELRLVGEPLELDVQSHLVGDHDLLGGLAEQVDEIWRMRRRNYLDRFTVLAITFGVAQTVKRVLALTEQIRMNPTIGLL